MARIITGLLERNAVATVAIVGFTGSLLSISSRFTGNVIGNSSAANNWISLLFFSIGGLFALLYFWMSREKKSRKKKRR